MALVEDQDGPVSSLLIFLLLTVFLGTIVLTSTADDDNDNTDDLLAPTTHRCEPSVNCRCSMTIRGGARMKPKE